MSRGKFDKKPVAVPGENKTGKKGSKSRFWLKVLIVVLSVILVLMILVSAGLSFVLDNLGRFDDPELHGNEDTTPITDEFDTDSTIAGQETIQTINATDVTLKDVETLVGEDIVNIMLIGQDARPGEGRSRSDTMILVTLNRTKNAIQLTSFMRDTYVKIPGYVDNRLNVAYRYGGTELMNETFLKNFGVEIDGNVMVDFTKFALIIDMLGGVTIDLSWEEVNYLSNRGHSVSVGENHLDGETTLAFVRMRKVSGGDYGRTERQRRVLTALGNSFRDASIGTILDLVKEILPYVVTNLTDAQILDYATSAVSLMGDGAEIQSLRIPADDAHYGAMIDGMSVLVPDLEMCREDLEEFIYATEPEE